MSEASPPPSGPFELPKMPVGIDTPSNSELIPFSSKHISLRKSGILLPLAATGIACILLFFASFNDDYTRSMNIIAIYLFFILFYALHKYSGIKKNIAFYLSSVAIVSFVLLSPVFGFLQLIFEQTLSTMPRPETGFAASLYGNFNIGLCEELAKAIPALIGLAIALQPAQPAGAPPQNGPFEWLKCSSPLDGVLIGVAAGIAFTSLETLHQYVPDVINKAKASGDAAGVAKGFALLIPRLLDAVIGHSAWAGVSGYFIGLATRYPKKIVMLLAIGWVVPAALHGFWDAMTHLGEMALFKKVIWVAGAVNLLLFVACLLKAKQLYATEMGGASTDSIIIGAPAGAAWASPAPVAAPQQQAFAPQPPPFSPPPPQQPAPPPQHVAPAATAPAVPPVPKFALANGANRFGVLVGQTIDLAALFPGCGLPASCLAEVNAHPNDASIVGLKNLTGDTWVVQFETGAMTSVGPGRNVKLVDKAKIVIGGATVEVQQI